jgi:hypothetical protein
MSGSVRVLVLLVTAARLEAQDWNAPATLSLVDRAILHRQRAEADSSLESYRATGRGIVTFHAEVGVPGTAPGRLFKGDELSVEVYWQRPDRSKQVIRAWRDSTFFPTDINYHRDHLGIVTNDFGPEIRLGGGDEVSGVIHPLGPAARAWYDYAARDPITIRTPAGALVLVPIDVRPKDPARPGVIGSIYLDRDRAVLVRSQFTFTRACYRDPDLEDIVVRLDRSLIDGRYWLPVHQEIELRRRLAVVDFPVRSVIRGRWDLLDYEINPRLPAGLFAGPSIDGLMRPGGVWPDSTPLARGIDSSLTPLDRGALAAVRREAARAVRATLLDGLPRTRLSFGRLSDVVKVNRVQGLALAAGVELRQLVGIDRVRLELGVGTSDGRVTGGVGLEQRVGDVRIAGAVSRRIRDFSDREVASGVVGSLAAQETGHDFGDYVLVEEAGLHLERDLGVSGRLSVEGGREWGWSVATAATPASGQYRPNPALGDGGYWVLRAAVAGAGHRADGGDWGGRIGLEGGTGRTTYGRAFATGGLTRKAPGGEVGLRGEFGLGTSGLPARRTFAIGGRSTLPGEPFRAFGGRVMVLGAAEWLFRVPGPRIPLGWLGRMPSAIWIGPLIAAGAAGGSVGPLPWQPSGGVRPVVGLAAEFFARVIRVEVGQALRGGRGPGVTVDIARELWKLL